MPTITIKHRDTEAVLFTHEVTDEQQSSGLAMRATLEAACKDRADLGGAYLRDAYLGGADLRGADLGGAYLRDAYLRGADLGGAYLRGADLGGAYLGGADLRGAYLGGAYLGGAYLGGAYLCGADLRGADLRGKKLISERPVLQVGPIGSRQDYLLSFITDGGVILRAGCFEGSRDEFAAAVEKTHGASAHGDEYRAALVLIDAHAKAWTPAVEPVAEAA